MGKDRSTDFAVLCIETLRKENVKLKVHNKIMREALIDQYAYNNSLFAYKALDKIDHLTEIETKTDSIAES